MKRINLFIHSCLILLTVTGVLLATPGSVQAQTMPPGPDDNLSRWQLASFDSFLDSHLEVAEQVRQNPSLVNNEDFVEAHPALQQYLQQHPEIREQISQNPNGVMRQEQRFDRRHPALQQFLASHPGVREEYKENPNGFMSREQNFDRREDQPRDRDVTHQELVNMDRFMDSHPEIAEQLRKNPSLVNNEEFVENHPALQQFLASHPGVREEYKENPNGFMSREQNFDRREDQARDRDVTHQELVNMDRFMDSHPEIAEQLHKNPSLVNNEEFVEKHPALQQFLASHPGVREEYKENPNGFMSREQNFDRREDSNFQRDRDVTGGELGSFHEFMEGHSNIAGELSKNPSLANNKEYLESHPELREYLKAHPQVHEELSENPQSFLKSAQQFDTHSTPKVTGQPKPNK